MEEREADWRKAVKESTALTSCVQGWSTDMFELVRSKLGYSTGYGLQYPAGNGTCGDTSCR